MHAPPCVFCHCHRTASLCRLAHRKHLHLFIAKRDPSPHCLHTTLLQTSHLHNVESRRHFGHDPHCMSHHLLRALLQPLWNPSFGMLLLPMQNPNFGMLLQPMRNPNFGTLLSPLWNPNFGMLMQPLPNLSFGTLLPPLWNPNFGTLLQPLRNSNFATLLKPQFSCLVD